MIMTIVTSVVSSVVIGGVAFIVKYVISSLDKQSIRISESFEKQSDRMCLEITALRESVDGVLDKLQEHTIEEDKRYSEVLMRLNEIDGRCKIYHPEMVKGNNGV